MPGYKITHQQGLHFVTFTVVGWIDIFSRKVYRDILIDSLKYCQKEKGLHINAFVIMSNHMHLIGYSNDNNLSDIIRDFKKFTSISIIKSVIANYRESRSEWMLRLFKYYSKYNKNNSKFQFWKQDNRPIELLSPKWINQKINYIHLNPVRAGLVNEPEHYVYSSAKNYLFEEGIMEVEVIDLSNESNFF